MDKFYWAVTGIDNAKGLVASIKRHEMDAWQRKGAAVIRAQERPWGVLAGHMTSNTQIRQFDTLEDAETFIKDKA